MLAGFSYGSRFAPAAGAAAMEAGIDLVHCAVVFHATRYEGLDATANHSLIFLGNFRLADKAPSTSGG
jgi:hypothetical protein